MIVLQVELGFLCVLALLAYLRMRSFSEAALRQILDSLGEIHLSLSREVRTAPAHVESKAPLNPTSAVEILRLDGTKWCHHSYRESDDHPDVLEALSTPGLAIRRSGKDLEVGFQLTDQEG